MYNLHSYIDSDAMSSSDETTETIMPRIIGQVKWFNNKAGYGFITVSSGDHKGKDIFIHYSAIRVVNSQYKYLVQGEYVEFGLVKSTSPEHEFQAVDISGINNGPLMCETRNISQGSAPVSGERRSNFQPRRFRSNRGPGGRDETKDTASTPAAEQNGDFTVVQRRRPTTSNGNRRRPVASEGEAAVAVAN